MSVCERCWADAGGSHERYLELLAERASNPCTPEQQAGKPRERDGTFDDYAGCESGLNTAPAVALPQIESASITDSVAAGVVPLTTEPGRIDAEQFPEGR